MGHFTSLKESTSQEAKEIYHLIVNHPSYSYIRTSYLYDQVYLRFRDLTDNLSEARIRTVLHMLHIMDEIGKSLGIIDANTSNSVPEHLFHKALGDPKYKAYSPFVTYESRLRQQQRERAKDKQEAKDPTDINNIMHSFVRPKKE